MQHMFDVVLLHLVATLKKRLFTEAGSIWTLSFDHIAQDMVEARLLFERLVRSIDSLTDQFWQLVPQHRWQQQGVKASAHAAQLQHRLSHVRWV
jgi:hypothetical protein